MCVFLPWSLCSEGRGGGGGGLRGQQVTRPTCQQAPGGGGGGGRGLMSGLPSISALTDGGSARLGSSPVFTSAHGFFTVSCDIYF